MSKSVQPPLPGTGIRIVVSAVWYGADRPCSIRATADTPSDEFATQVVGWEVTDYFTAEELCDALGLMHDRLVHEILDHDPGSGT